ncbi:MAG: GDP-mannose 4,6-dehydratase [Planctomycetota bacterium]
MRVLLTGATGFIGAHFFERLARKGDTVAGFIRSVGNATLSSASRLSRLERIVETHPNARLLHAARFADAESAIAAFAPTACIHLAGRSSVRESVNHPGLYADVNCAGTIELLEVLRRAGCPRVIHASSVMVYGKDAPLPYSEARTGSAPASFYGASKLAAETVLNTWRVLHGMETINLRLFSVYGPDLRADSVPHLIASAIREQREFTVFGNGGSVRDYIEIEDVADALEAALRVRWSQDFPAALNIGTGVGTSLLEMIRTIEGAMNETARLVFKPTVPGELQAIIAECESAKRMLKWEPRVNRADGIARMAEWFNATR